MTPVLAVLLYLRLVLYPTVAIGFLMLSILSMYPDERRQAVYWRRWLYLALAVLFSVYGMTVLVRLVANNTLGLQFVDYFSNLPLATLVVIMGFNLRMLVKRI